jgi:CopG family nickel-responsive transcriptional regulator
MLSDKLNDVQHEHYRAILSTVHVHLDHDSCLEVVLVRGKARAIEKLANSLIATKGVKHGRYTLTASAGDLP